MVKKIILKITKSIIVLAASIIGLGLMLPFFWEKVRIWFETPRFIGCDTPMFIHYVYHHMANKAFPVKSWVHIFHNGYPRLFDASWLQFYFVEPFVKAFGVYKAAKIYPILCIFLLVVFCYLLFLQLSGSVLISLALALSVLLSEALYVGLFYGGIVLSVISHMFFPAQLLFAIRYYEKRKGRDLVLAGIMAAIGFYSHGLLMMMFAFIPTFVVLFFATEKVKQLISKKSLLQAFFFASTALSVGALGVWPHIQLALEGGMTSYPLGYFDKRPQALREAFTYSHVSVWYIFVFAVLAGLIFWIALKKKPKKILKPLFIIQLAYIFWFFTYSYIGNRMQPVLFPSRLFWFFPVITGAISATLLSPLSQYSAKKVWQSFLRFVSYGAVKIAVLAAVCWLVFPLVLSYRFLTRQLFSFKWPEYDLIAEGKETYDPLLKIADLDNLNQKLFAHGSHTMFWNRLSQMPQARGHFHFWTHLTRLWDGWLYATLTRGNWESQQIPRQMAEKQGLFFLDWYGIRYLFGAGEGDPEFMLAGNFYEDKDYVTNKDTDEFYHAFEISPEYTSGIVEAVRSPAVGFVGSQDSYFYFVKDLAMLNYNTSKLVPIKLADSVEGIKKKQLNFLDGLIIYDFKKKNSLLYNAGWNKVLDFVNRGGRVWVDSGGNSYERENSRSPEVFPVRSTKYSDLGKNWQPGGSIGNSFDFSLLEHLEYRGSPWQFSYADHELLKNDSQVLLTQNNKVIAAKRKLNNGLVLWTGINIFYRPEEYRRTKGMEEADLIKEFLDIFLDGLPQGRVEAKVERVKAELYRLEGKGFSGVVFKQIYFPGWKAKAEYRGKTVSLPYFVAGPELSYFPLPEKFKNQPVKVKIYYQGRPFYWFCFLLVVIGLLASLDQIFGGHLAKFLLLNKIKLKLPKSKFTHLKKWWEDEEE